MKSNQFEAFGIAAMLPGMRLAHEKLGKEIEDYERRLAELQGSEPLEALAAESGASAQNLKLLDAATRKRGRKGTHPNHPRHPDHPKHKAWVRKTVKARAKAMAKQAQQPTVKPVVAKKKRWNIPTEERGKNLPLTVNGMYTRRGAAEELGTSYTNIDHIIRQFKMKSTKQKVEGRGTPISLISAAEVARVKAARNGANA